MAFFRPVDVERETGSSKNITVEEIGNSVQGFLVILCSLPVDS